MKDEVDLSGISDADIRAYLEAIGVDPNGSITQAKTDAIGADLANAKASGNTKLTNTLDVILKYLGAGLTILTKNGIIGKQEVAQTLPSLGGLSTDNGASTNQAPAPNQRVFGIDFSDPKVLIIGVLLIGITSYFLFFNKSKPKNKK